MKDRILKAPEAAPAAVPNPRYPQNVTPKGEVTRGPVNRT